LYRSRGAAYDVGRLEKARGGREVDTTATLSASEREIGLMAARGKSNEEIACALSISQKTVEKHLATAFPQDRHIVAATTPRVSARRMVKQPYQRKPWL
jgi:FixJ family two-component response regulator